MARLNATLTTVNDKVSTLLQQKFNPVTDNQPSTTVLPAPVAVADRSNSQIPPIPCSCDPSFLAAQSGGANPPAVTTSQVNQTPEIKAAADAPSGTTTLDTKNAPETQSIAARVSEKAAAERQGFLPEASSSPLTGTNKSDIRTWETQMQTLEQENQALRQKLRLNVSDPIHDIEVDTVANIHEDVLKARIHELEREIDTMSMKNDGVLPQKTEPDRPNNPTPEKPTAQ